MSTTWSTTNFGASGVFTTGTESAPSGASAGLDMSDKEGVSVIVELGANTFSTGTLLAYVYNADSTNWIRAYALDITPTASGNSSEAFPGLPNPIRCDRLAYVPSGLSGGGTLYIHATRRA